MTAARTLRTLIHLRPEQVAWRLWYRARLPWFASAGYDRILGSASAAPVAAPPVNWLADAAEGRRILAGRIRLVGLEGAVDGWDDQDQPLLWRFTLHYFEWLPHLVILGDEGRAAARDLVGRWLDRFERFHPVAWHPYPLSLRLFSWLAHAPWLTAGADSAFTARFHAALHRMAHHLTRVWERDVSGNHLIKNLKAQAAAAVCLPGCEAMLDPALAALDKELARQILADGCHYERSPSYHLQVLEDLRELAALLPSVPDALQRTITAMEPALAFFRHGDKGLALFNDGTVDCNRPSSAGPVPQALPKAGYWRLTAGPAMALIDCGPVCPDDLPAHAHADTLSFEFSVGPDRVVVNSGTFAYQDPLWRNVFRGTPAHSTVTVDDGDSAEVYGVFRLGRRPRRFQAEGGGRSFTGSHDGWRRLGLTHRRGLRLSEDGLIGWDEIERQSNGPAHRITARFHLHPLVAATVINQDVRLRLPSGGEWLFTASGGVVEKQPSRYAPRFHTMIENSVLTVSAIMDGPAIRLDWRFSRR